MKSNQFFKNLILEIYGNLKEEEEDIKRSKSGRKLTKMDNPSAAVIGNVDDIKIKYQNDRPSTDVDNSVLDRKIKSIAKKVEEESGESITDISFGKVPWRGGSKGALATELKIGLTRKKPFTASILPGSEPGDQGRVVFSFLSNKWRSEKLTDEISKFLSTFKSSKGRSSKLTVANDVKLSSSLENRGNDILQNISKDAGDVIKKATISREGTKGGKDPNVSIILKVEFEKIGTLMAGVKVEVGSKDKSFYMYNRTVQPKTQGVNLNDPNTYVNVDKTPYNVKVAVGSSYDKDLERKKGNKDKNGFVAVNPGKNPGEYIVYLSDLGFKELEKGRGNGVEDITPYKGKKFVKEEEATSKPKALFNYKFKDKSGNVVYAKWLSDETKKKLKDFMNDINLESLRENKFKNNIQELADKIAEQDIPNKPEPDAERVKELLRDMGARLETPLKAIEKATELRDVIKGMVAMMPNVKEPAIRSALNSVLTTMAKAKAAGTSNKRGSKKSKNAAYDGMPVPKELQGQVDKLKQQDELDKLDNLGELFKRIKRK